MPEGLRLIGFLTLVPDQTGFLDPVFQNGSKRYIQRGRDGFEAIAGFDEISLAFAVEPRPEAEPVLRRIGDARLFTFRFSDGTLALGDRQEMAGRLKDRFFEFYGEDEFRANGLLLLDVLSFLECEQAIAQEMTARTLAGLYAGARDSRDTRPPAERLFQYGFTYAALSGRITAPFDPGILCLRESDVRPAIEAGLRRLKTGRLLPVFGLWLATGAILAAAPLQSWHGLTPEQLHMASQGAAGLASLWLLYEVTALSGRVGRRGLAGWLVRRFRQIMVRR